MQIAPEEELKVTLGDPVPASSLLESRTSHLLALLQEELELAFHKQTSTVSLEEIIKITSEHSPIDLAYAVSCLPPHTRSVIYENLFGIDAKIDFMVNADQQPYVLEVNTIPGMTETSLLPKAAAQAGMSYAQLCDRILKLSLEKKV